MSREKPYFFAINYNRPFRYEEELIYKAKLSQPTMDTVIILILYG
jgi:hypothetical protein